MSSSSSSGSVPERTAGDDPGFWRSVSSGTPLGQLRLTGLAFSAIPALIAALVPFVLDKEDDGPLAVSAVVVVVVAAGAAVLAALYAPRQLEAFPATTSVEQATREGVLRMRTVMYLRISLAQLAILAGFAMSLVANSYWPYLIGFVLGWPIILASLPTRGHVQRARERMESAGARVPLWDALLTR